MEQYIEEILRLIMKVKSLDAIPSIDSLNSLNSLQPITHNYNLMMLISCVALGFGILNMVFGYRLLRFWMMLFGFIVGGGMGFLVAYISGIDNHQTLIAAMIGTGVFLAVFSFLIYKAGIFIVGAGLGLSIGVYLIQPRTSLTFFLCILAGVGVGSLALKFSKGIIIVGTSILGGVTTGFAACWLANLEEYPYGVGMAVLFTIMATIIQFAYNRSTEEEREEKKAAKEAKRQKKLEKNRRREYEEESDSALYDDYYEDDEVEDDFQEEDLERLRKRRLKSKEDNQFYYDLKENDQKKRTAKSEKTEKAVRSSKTSRKTKKEEIELFPVQRNK